MELNNLFYFMIGAIGIAFGGHLIFISGIRSLKDWKLKIIGMFIVMMGAISIGEYVENKVIESYNQGKIDGQLELLDNFRDKYKSPPSEPDSLKSRKI